MAKWKNYRSLIDLYLDGEADESQTRILFSHIENCEKCQKRFEDVKQLYDDIKSVPGVSLPEGFWNSVLDRIQADETGVKKHFRLFPVLNWAGIAVILLVIFAVIWRVYDLEPAAIMPEIHVVSPLENAALEEQYVDISVAFSSGSVENIRVLLDGKDVTDATEVNQDFMIYTSDELQNGYHIATVQITDKKGIPMTQHSWTFFIIPTESG